MPKKTQNCILLDRDAQERLDAKSKKEGIPKNIIIQMLIKEHIKWKDEN